MNARLSGFALALWLAVALQGGACAADAARPEGARPEVAKPLQAVQELLKSRRYHDALLKLREVEAVKDRSAYENYLIERLRGAAAAGAGDSALAARSLEVALGSGQVPPAEQPRILEALAKLEYGAKDYGKAIQWLNRYFSEGGADPLLRQLLIQSYYLSHDLPRAVKELLADLLADERAGRAPAEEKLQLLANCYVQQKDSSGYASALERLLRHHPKREYWLAIIEQVRSRPGFAARLELDLYRLRMATGVMDRTAQFVEMAQLALQEGFPAEAREVVDRGFNNGLLGIGPDADRHRRLQALVARGLAEDQKTIARDEAEAIASRQGTGMVNLGFERVFLGQADRGLALMEQGIARGGLKHPEDARLHLGLANLRAGRREAAQPILSGIQGSDGTADLARLWLLVPARAP